MGSFYDLKEVAVVDRFCLDMAQRPLAPWGFACFLLLWPSFFLALVSPAGLVLFAALFPLTVLVMMGASFWHPRARFEVTETRFIADAWAHAPLPWPRLLILPVHGLEIEVEALLPWRTLHQFTLIVQHEGQRIARIPALGATRADLERLRQRIVERQPRAAERHGDGEEEVPRALNAVLGRPN